MKRARKGKLSAGRGSRKKATDPKERRIINKEDNNELYKVNSQEEEELRRKYFGEEANTAQDRKSTRLNSSHMSESRMPSSA